MSFVDQAMKLVRGGSDLTPEERLAARTSVVVSLTDAAARTDAVHWGDGSQNLVRITGVDGAGEGRSLSFEFEEPFRGEAAVFVDEVRRTGSVVLRGPEHAAGAPFKVHDARSGEASMGPEQRRFSPMRALSSGIASLAGRTSADVEIDAVAVHRLERDGAG